MPESPYPGPPPPGPRPDDVPPAPRAATEANGARTTAPEQPPAPACGVCGAELDADQTYCLECGAPTTHAPRLRRGAGGLAAVAVGLAMLGAGAGALAYVASQDDGPAGQAQSSAATLPDTSSIITVPTTPVPTTETDSSLPGDTVGTTSTFPTDTTYTTPTDGALPSDTTATVPDSGVLTVTGPGVDGQTSSEVSPVPVTPSDPGISGTDDWPSGTSGWTAIVSSVHSEADARATSAKLQASGQPGGVLWSTDHPPLRTGYWVVFSGTFTTRTEALAHARTLVSSWPGAYPRQIDS